MYTRSQAKSKLNVKKYAQISSFVQENAEMLKADYKMQIEEIASCEVCRNLSLNSCRKRKPWKS